MKPAGDAECNTESGGDTPEPALGPECADQSTQETTPTGVAVAGSPRRSGRVSQPPKALADHVLTLTEHFRICFSEGICSHERSLHWFCLD